MDFPVTRRLAHRFGISLDGDGETFRVHGFSAQERLSEPFCVSIEVASRKNDVDFDALLGKTAVLTITDEGAGGGEPRYFHGVITSIRQRTPTSDGEKGHSLYSLEIEPEVALMRLTSDCRIFQQKTVKDVVSTLLQENNVTKVRWATSRTLKPREFCTQYQETDFAFMQRLLAEEGIWYCFEHTKDEHTLVFVDRNGAEVQAKAPKTMLYNGASGGNADHACISRFNFQKTLGSGKAVQRDYSFRNPRYNFETSSSGQRDADHELYFFPGRYKDEGVGKDYTRMWLEASRALLARGEGQSNIHGLAAGGITELTDYREGVDGTQLIVSVMHNGSQGQAVEENAGDSGCSYSNAFICIPNDVPFRPARRVKPLVEGLQMATVVGPAGEEIYTDEYGRVKIQFAWDRYGKMDDTSSCWIRVTQNWSGLRWGQVALPRIGDEVLIAFLEGDPDQPIVASRAFNDRNRQPYTLPDFKTRMTIQSKTHKGNGYNELRFEDEKGEEEVYLQAEKYLNAEIKNDETWHIGGSRHKRVDGSQSESIEGAKDIEVKGSHTEVISGGMSLKVESVRKAEVGTPGAGGEDHLIVHGDQAERIKGNWTRHVGRNIRMESDAHQQYKAPGTIFLDGGDMVVLRAGSVISLNVGGNFIRIDDSGVTIEGTTVNINTGGGAPAKGKDVPMIEPNEADKYQGPYAERYERSFKK